MSPVHKHRHLGDGAFIQVQRPFLPFASPRIRGLPARIAVVAQRVARLLDVVAGRPELATLQLGTVRTPPRGALFPARAEALAYYPLEREPEVFREQRVNYGVYHAVAVTQPEHHREQEIVYARVAECPDQVHGEERQPAEDEAADYDAEGFGRLRFHPEALHLSLDVPLSHALRDDLGLTAVFAAAGGGTVRPPCRAVAAARPPGRPPVRPQPLHPQVVVPPEAKQSCRAMKPT